MQLNDPQRILPVLMIGDLRIEAPLILAPMAGITDRIFRGICRRIGAGMVFTEMMSAEAIMRDSPKTWNAAKFNQNERPVAAQLFSHDPAVLAEAAVRLEELNPDCIDLNFGCPVRKVVRRGAGAGFLADLNRLSDAVKSVVEKAKKPVTVKIRSGILEDHLNAVETAKRAQDEGASAITVHARTARQFFKGSANWDIIAQVKSAVDIPVIGNGDVFSPDDMVRMSETTGCDGVMIGRGALGNPWIFSACAAAIKGETWQAPSPEERWEIIKEHLEDTFNEKGLSRGIKEMRKHLGWYSRGLQGAAQFRAVVFNLTDAQEVLKRSEEFFRK